MLGFGVDQPLVGIDDDPRGLPCPAPAPHFMHHIAVLFRRHRFAQWRLSYDVRDRPQCDAL